MSGLLALLDDVAGIAKVAAASVDEQALTSARQLSISGLFGRIPDVTIATEVYEPQLTVDELAADRETRDEQLHIEGDRMRGEMIRMLDELKAERRP